MSPLGEHRRSVAFLDHEGTSWACYLVTHAARSGRWHGYLSFRSADAEADGHEVRTADIFIEGSEAAIHQKARGLGRPLLGGLLASALHTGDRRRPGLGRRFRELIGRKTGALPASGEGGTERDDDLRSLYASYRLDQVAHFICLVAPDAFEAAVDRILDGERVDFRTKDRIQFAMMVVSHIERHLPLPPFEVWVEDYRAHPDDYRLYTHTLHREGRLP